MAKRLLIVSLLMMTLLVTDASASPAGETSKTSVTFFWALYDGLTEEFRTELQDAFNAAHDGIAVEVVPV